MAATHQNKDKRSYKNVILAVLVKNSMSMCMRSIRVLCIHHVLCIPSKAWNLWSEHEEFMFRPYL